MNLKEIENKILDDKDDPIKTLMIELMPSLYNAIYKSALSIAMDTKLSIISSREELKKSIKDHPDIVESCKFVFQNALKRYKKIQKRIEKSKNLINHEDIGD